MSRWTVFGLLFLVLAGTGCQSEQDSNRPAAVLDQLSARETAYHSSVGDLPDAAAIRTETAAYAGDMHGLLDSMRGACAEMMQGRPMMGGYSLDDMIALMDGMRTCIDDYASRLNTLEVLPNMRAACNEHHAAMNEMLQQMDGMLNNQMGCCGGR